MAVSMYARYSYYSSGANTTAGQINANNASLTGAVAESIFGSSLFDTSGSNASASALFQAAGDMSFARVTARAARQIADKPAAGATGSTVNRTA